jgi:amidase
VRCFERAREQARAIDALPVRPPLGGIPIVVKDNNDVGGVATSGGTAIFKDRMAAASDRTVARMEGHGAIPMAKANLSELGGANTTNRLFGTTLNPRDPRLTCGGSSGGSAVAVATGQVWLAHGNDVGGSLRIPPAFCGITGLRPTPGRIVRKAMCDPFDTIMVDGPLARSVEDLGLLFDAMVGFDPADPLSAPSPDGPFLDAARQPRRARGSVAACANPGGLAVDPEIVGVFEKAMSRIAAAGVDVRRAVPSCDGARPAIAALRGEAYALAWEPWLAQLGEAAFTPEVLGDIRRGLTQDPAVLRSAQRWRVGLARDVATFWQTHSLFICPATQAMPFDARQSYPTEIAGVRMETYFDWISIDYLWSLVGCPVLAVPAGLGPSGQPVGLQVMGPPRSEARLLAFGAWLERELWPSATVVDPPAL